jgi:thiaminase/transcriptional activator TenA
MPDALTPRLWRAIEPVYAAILAHPFVTGLTDGTLPRDAFRFYVVQDAHYLREYAKALAVLAGRGPSEHEIITLARHAAGAIEVERSLHDSFFRDFDLSEAEVAATPLAPTTVAYTSYLLATAHGGSFAEGMGAVLPCYWIYREVGQELLRRGSPDPLYQRWIDTYGGEEFAAVVQEAIAITDAAGTDLGPAEQARVERHFVTTSRYEWLFWDAGWRQETWPV